MQKVPVDLSSAKEVLNDHKQDLEDARKTNAVAVQLEAATCYMFSP